MFLITISCHRLSKPNRGQKVDIFEKDLGSTGGVGSIKNDSEVY